MLQPSSTRPRVSAVTQPNPAVPAWAGLDDLPDAIRHRFVEPIARGGMSTVYLAIDRSTGRRVAAKVLDRRLARRPGIMDRFVAEREVSALADHHNLGRVIDAGWTLDGLPYLIMDLLDGETLADLHERGPIEVGAVAAVGAQVADAVAALHAAGVAHCDLKPENVIVQYEVGLAGWPRIAVIDFGVARRVDEPCDNDDDAVSGTPSYMAPEQWEGRPCPASDVYALGCVLHELLTGDPPFVGSLAELVIAHRSGAPRPASSYRPGVPMALDALILAMLAKPPAERPTMAAVARTLADLAFAWPPGARADRAA